jgi:hypothetical protein
MRSLSEQAIPKQLRARAAGLEDLVRVSVALGYHEAAEVLSIKVQELLQEATDLEKVILGSALFGVRMPDAIQ